MRTCSPELRRASRTTCRASKVERCMFEILSFPLRLRYRAPHGARAPGPACPPPCYLRYTGPKAKVGTVQGAPSPFSSFRLPLLQHYPKPPKPPKAPTPQTPLPPPCRVLPSFPLPRAADAADADAPATIRRAPGLSPFPCSVAVGSPSSEIPLRARGGRGPGAPDVFWLLWHVAPAIRRAGGAAAAGRGAKRGRRPPPRASGAPSPASRRRCARTARCSPAPGGRCW